MDTLSELRGGRLQGAAELRIKADLDTFPPEILDLAESLEILDLSGNRLRELPEGVERLAKLRIVFLSGNDFETFPEVLGRCPALEMVGFKSNRLTRISETALPERLRWLILTDNLLPSLPASLGKRPHLQKLMLAGNRLERLPDLSGCEGLELARLSANRLEHLPDALFELPRLTWLAFSGNPFCQVRNPDARTIPWNQLHLEERLGEGASGVVFRAIFEAPKEEREVAVKVFKGGVTSDGRTSDEEAATLAAGTHPHLVPVLGRFSGHPQGLDGLVLELVPERFRALAAPPSFESCTRDVYRGGAVPDSKSAHRIVEGMSSLLGHLHGRGICHGDVYGHNILVDEKGHALLGDFGAAGFLGDLPHKQAMAMIECEQRALLILAEELASG